MKLFYTLLRRKCTGGKNIGNYCLDTHYHFFYRWIYWINLSNYPIGFIFAYRIYRVWIVFLLLRTYMVVLVD